MMTIAYYSIAIFRTQLHVLNCPCNSAGVCYFVEPNGTSLEYSIRCQLKHGTMVLIRLQYACPYYLDKSLFSIENLCIGALQGCFSLSIPTVWAQLFPKPSFTLECNLNDVTTCFICLQLLPQKRMLQINAYLKDRQRQLQPNATSLVCNVSYRQSFEHSQTVLCGYHHKKTV